MEAPIDIKDAAHILFRVLNRLKLVHGDYNSLVNGLHTYIETFHGKKFQMKVTTLLGNSEPSNPSGEAQRFLNTYFSGMNASNRISYFYQNYFGGQTRYQTLLSNMKNLDDGMRVKLSETPDFIIIGLTNKNSVGETDLYHITISRDSAYDVAGQHGVPTTVPVRKSIHFTDESTGLHYFVKYPSFSSPLNEDAADLLSTIKPGRWGGRKTIRRKMSKLSKKKGTSKRLARR